MTTLQIADTVLSVSSATATDIEVSEWADTTGASRVTLTGVVSQFATTGTATGPTFSVKIILQGSNDRANWFDLDTSPPSATSVGNFPSGLSGIDLAGYAFCRVRWELTVGGTASTWTVIVAATMSLTL
jgi:hypothetical protein